MIIDSHCHLSDERLKERIGEIVENFEDEGIEGVVEVGFDLPSSKNAVKLSEKYKNGLWPLSARIRMTQKTMIKRARTFTKARQNSIK